MLDGGQSLNCSAILREESLSSDTKIPGNTENGPPPTELKRALGLWALVAFGVGDILGAGVYALVGKIAGLVGYGAWMSYLIAAVLAGLSGLTYAELTSRFPRAGGAAHFIHEVFRNRFVTFLVIFFVALSGLFSFATSSHTFAKYSMAFAENADPIFQNILLPLAYVALVGYITARGIMLSSISNIICCVIEISALAFIIVVGLSFLGGVDYTQIAEPLEGQNFGKAGVVLAGAALAFFAFIGFEDMANLAEEARDPQRQLPIAICLAIVITTVIYILIAFVAVSVIPPVQLAATDTPLLDVVATAAPWFPPEVYSIVPAFAVFNTGLLNLLMASRLFYGMASGPNGQLPKVLAYVHPRWKTPVVALVFAAAIVVVMVLSTTDVSTLAGGTVTFLLLVFAILHLSLIRAKIKSIGHTPKFRTPIIFPVLGIFICLLLLFSRDLEEYRVALMLTLAATVLFAVNWFFLGRKTVEPVD